MIRADLSIHCESSNFGSSGINEVSHKQEGGINSCSLHLKRNKNGVSTRQIYCSGRTISKKKGVRLSQLASGLHCLLHRRRCSAPNKVHAAEK